MEKYAGNGAGDPGAEGACGAPEERNAQCGEEAGLFAAGLPGDGTAGLCSAGDAGDPEPIGEDPEKREEGRPLPFDDDEAEAFEARQKLMERGRRIGEILKDIRESGVPEGFPMARAARDRRFTELLLTYPAGAAMAVWDAEDRADTAERRVAERLLTRRELPPALKGRGAVAAEPDYAGMDRDSFFALKERLMRGR